MNDLFPDTINHVEVAARRLPRTDRRILAEIPQHLRQEAQERWEERSKIIESRNAVKAAKRSEREAARAAKAAARQEKRAEKSRRKKRGKQRSILNHHTTHTHENTQI